MSDYPISKWNKCRQDSSKSMSILSWCKTTMFWWDLQKNWIRSSKQRMMWSIFKIKLKFLSSSIRTHKMTSKRLWWERIKKYKIKRESLNRRRPVSIRKRQCFNLQLIQRKDSLLLIICLMFEMYKLWSL